MRKVDVAIIGAGSAGLSALSEVRKETDNFVIINHGPYGTSCARVACMPTKALIDAARAYQGRLFLPEIGVAGVAGLAIDIPAVLRHVRRLRDGFVSGMVKETEGLGDKSITATARFAEPDVIRVNDTLIKAGRVVIATGSTPVFPEEWHQFGPRFLTTDEIFEQLDLPGRMAVVGLGPSGLEFAQALHYLGIQVSAFEAGSLVGGLSDPEVNRCAVEKLASEFALHRQVKVEIAAAGEELVLRHGGQETRVDRVLLTMGRRPALAGLGLEQVGVALGPRGVPAHDPETMRIAGFPIYIAGDANNDRPILHEAVDEGHIAGYNAVRSEDHCFKRRTGLAITFTEPNIARVGRSFASLKEGEYVVGDYDFGGQSRARMSGSNHGCLRLYAARENGRLLGAEMAAPAGEHLAHLLAWSIGRKATLFDMLQQPCYHPVVEEGLRTAIRKASSLLPSRPREIEMLLCRSQPSEEIC